MTGTALATQGFDVVIVGAGSAGCVLAARLSEDPARRVLLLEAGGSDRSMILRKPGMVSVIHTVPQVKQRFDWGYKTDGQAHMDGRVIPYTRGKVLGGSSAINGMVFVRGHRAIYDGWAAEGCEGWAWEDVLPHFRRLEDWEGGASDTRGTGGPIKVSRPPLDDMSPVSRAFLEACSGATGVPVVEDYNGEEQEGASRFQFSFRDGLRYSTSEGYLQPALARPNLTVVTGALVHRVLFRGSRAVGVRYAVGSRVTDAMASQEVVLSAGAVGSPHLLLLSGVGPADELRRLKLDVVADLPVGRNLVDHLFFPMTFLAPRGGHTGTPGHFFGGMLRELLFGGTWFGRSVFESVAFLRSEAGLAAPDLQLHTLPWAYPRNQDDSSRRPEVDKRPAFTMQPTMLAPRSRGTLRLRTAQPDDAPHVDPAFLADPEDVRTLLRGIALTREIAAHPALASEFTGELEPGAEVTGDALLAQLRYRAATVYHPVGTCRMGTDAQAVVDPSLRVRGVEGLRVVDASIMPSLPSGNTNAASIMIGEKGATLLAAG
ncbi:MAG: GMC family oxidoreductase N-terminal domain-containing protein [Alphaproteobacteria bacterium]|nr:GMC family oxidoreductase N-terminal domain-containing protein [Alphaproteobacteria bacterium]